MLWKNTEELMTLGIPENSDFSFPNPGDLGKLDRTRKLLEAAATSTPEDSREVLHTGL
jgi:hypothetical protein